MKIVLTLLFCFLMSHLFAQTDTTAVVIHKDARIDALIKKQIDINEETTRDSRRTASGYRILVMNSNDRKKVFDAKARIHQVYP